MDDWIFHAYSFDNNVVLSGRVEKLIVLDRVILRLADSVSFFSNRSLPFSNTSYPTYLDSLFAKYEFLLR